MTPGCAWSSVSGVHFGLRDPQQRDWLAAGLLFAASQLQIWLAGGSGQRPLIGALFATGVCATVVFRRQYPATAGITAQGLMAVPAGGRVDDRMVLRPVWPGRLDDTAQVRRGRGIRGTH